MTSKPFWQSKTFWFNVLVAVYAVAVRDIEAFENLRVDTETVAGLTAFANLALRYVTTQPVRLG